MLEARDRAVRLATYAHFVETGLAPAPSEVARRVSLSSDGVREAWERLAAARVLVLDPDTRGLWMAMPFSAVPTGFRVLVAGKCYLANCAWDALGIPAMLDQDADVEAPDPMGGAPFTITIRGGEPEPGNLWVHFAVPAAQWWVDIGFT